MYRLSCAVQQYPWGKPAEESLVAKYQASNENNPSLIQEDPSKPFAELWMGTHTNGPSTVILDDGTRISLSEWLTRHVSGLFTSIDAWGPAHTMSVSSVYNFVKQGYNYPKQGQGCALPFLFKVLSVGRALSIQAHPDKELASKLHKSSPELYKDPNHKPELACALTNFEALCGFQPHESLIQNIDKTPELRNLFPQDALENFRGEIQNSNRMNLMSQLFTQFMKTDKDPVKKAVHDLVERLERNSLDSLSTADGIALRLHRDFPFDIGVFAPYWLNYVTLRPGESFFMAPNEPHAYLKGDCVECMACSDNVVRAGLTNKYKDVDTLCSMLTYKMQRITISSGEQVNAHTVKYVPPETPEFVLYRISIPPHTSGELIGAQEPSICLITEGSGSHEGAQLTEGRAYVMDAEYQCNITSGDEGISVFQIFCPPNGE